MTSMIMDATSTRTISEANRNTVSPRIANTAIISLVNAMLSKVARPVDEIRKTTTESGGLYHRDFDALFPPATVNARSVSICPCGLAS
jgi:hypothetical protein